MKKNRIRNFFYKIHLWLGIASGIVLFIVCLSGTIYTFRTEIEMMFEPSKYRVNTIPENSQPLQVDALVLKLKSENERISISQLVIPEGSDRTWMIKYTEKPPQGAGNRREGGSPPGAGIGGPGPGKEGKGQGANPGPGRARPKTMFVNPYTGETCGTSGGSVEAFFGSMMTLHRYLWLPTNIGRPIVGIATIIFGVLLISGFVLWLPRTLKNWKNWKVWKIGFQVRFQRGWKLFLYDTHNTLGFYMLIPLLIMTLTGLCWSFEWYRNAGSYLLGDKIFKQRNFQPMELPADEISINGRALSLQEIVDAQNEKTPGLGEITLTLPKNENTAAVTEKMRTGFFASAAKDKTQWNLAHGVAVAEEPFAQKKLGEKIGAMIKPLHLGDFYGTSSKILYFFACLVGTCFPLSGTILWINKLRAKKKNRPETFEEKPNTQNVTNPET